VVVVRDLVREIGDLGFQAGLPAVDEPLTQLAQLTGITHRTVLQNTFAAFEREVEAAEFCVPLLQLIHHPQGLQVVLEAAVGTHAVIERVLACVAEGRMAEIVGEGNGFR
jgi:hypothetical protein